MTVGKIAIRLLTGLLIAALVYVLGFTLYACKGNPGCAAMALPDIVDSLLGKPVYPNFITATGAPDDNLPITLHPAPSLIQLGLLAFAIALALEILTRQRRV